MISLLGDFNTKVGRENIFKPTIGHESLRQERKLYFYEFQREQDNASINKAKHYSRISLKVLPSRIFSSRCSILPAVHH